MLELAKILRLENYESVELKLENAIAKLHESRRDILKMLFGIGVPKITIEEIAEKLEIPCERVRQINKTTLRILRHYNNFKDKSLLKPYLE